MTDETYNGWKNHATWCVNLHLSNDEPLYREALARTEETVKNPPHVSEYWNEEETARYNVADMLKDWIEEMTIRYLERYSNIGLGPDEPRLLIRDLVGAYLGDVDWNETADNWIKQVSEVTA